MKKALKIVVNVLAWILVVIAAIMTITVFTSQGMDRLPNLFGYMPMSVQTPSMKPTINQGDLIIDKKISSDDIKELKKDDIITFSTVIEGEKAINTHRIVDKMQDNGYTCFVTRGDNNTVDDNKLVYAADVIAVYKSADYSGAKIPVLGSVMSFLNKPVGFLVCIVLPLLIFFLFEVFKFITVIVSMKKPKALSEEEEEEIKKKAVEEYLQSQKELPDGSQTEEQPKIDEAQEQPKQEVKSE